MKMINPEELSVGDITAEMLKKQALPIGMPQFIDWSERIIAGAMITASVRSQRFALAEMIMHLPPTEAFKEDAHFILKLRKACVNETAHAVMSDIKREQEMEKLAEDTAPKLGVIDGGVLADQTV